MTQFCRRNAPRFVHTLKILDQTFTKLAQCRRLLPP
jgi:hypothetical protein